MAKRPVRAADDQPGTPGGGSEAPSSGQSGSRVKREPTHVMRFEVPLYLTDPPDATDFDPIQDALHTIIALSRAAYLGAICDDAQVSLIAWPKEVVELHDVSDDLHRAALWVVDNWDAGATQHLSMEALRRSAGRKTKRGEQP